MLTQRRNVNALCGDLPGRAVCVVLRDEQTAKAFAADLLALGGVEAALLPCRDLVFHNMEGVSHEYEQQRLQALWQVRTGKTRVLCASADALMLRTLPPEQKAKVEFLCNECCWFGCTERKRCYETVSRQNLGEDCPDHRCAAPDAAGGYRFSKAMRSPGFIGLEDIRQRYLPAGFSQFKIEGRGLGSALVLEFLLYYMIKPEYQLRVREEIYLDNMLDLF